MTIHNILVSRFAFGQEENTFAGCSKRPDISPTQPQRVKTRRSAGKAAVSEEVRRTLRYVEPLSEARTKLVDFFSILLLYEQQAGSANLLP